jgi:hypothetical protein
MVRVVALGLQWRGAACVGEQVFVCCGGVTSRPRDPAWQAWRRENLRRSLAMLRPDQLSRLRKEEAIEFVEQLQHVQQRLDRLRTALRSAGGGRRLMAGETRGARDRSDNYSGRPPFDPVAQLVVDDDPGRGSAKTFVVVGARLRWALAAER